MAELEITRMLLRYNRLLLTFIGVVILSVTGCQTSSRPERTVSDFHKLLTTAHENVDLEDVATESLMKNLDSKGVQALTKVLLNRKILRRSSDGLEPAHDLVLDVYSSKDGRAQVNISKSTTATQVITYLLVLDGGIWKMTFVAEPLPIIPQREILVPHDKLWDR